MGLPNAEVTILNNQLGRVDVVDDRVGGLVLTCSVAPAGLALAASKKINTLAEAEALGIDAAYDIANTVTVFKQIKEFYDQAGNGTELWIMVVQQTNTMETIADKANQLARKLIIDAGGRIKLLGIHRNPDGGYVPTTVDGLDDDVDAAVLKGHALAEEMADNFNVKPLRVLIAGRIYQGDSGAVKDFRANDNNRVGGPVIFATEATGDPAVGFLLGKYLANPVQRNPGRVKDGDVGIVQGFLTDGSTIEASEAILATLHDKGYHILRKFPTKNGYFVNDDPACVALSDDYSGIARGRVMDKGHLITFKVYLQDVNNDIEVDENTGQLPPVIIAALKAKIEQNIRQQMANEISGVEVTINPIQNLLEQDTIDIEKIAITPRGYAKTITSSLAFNNPLNA